MVKLIHKDKFFVMLEPRVFVTDLHSFVQDLKGDVCDVIWKV